MVRSRARPRDGHAIRVAPGRPRGPAPLVVRGVVHLELADGGVPAAPTGCADDAHTITPGLVERKGVGGEWLCGVVERVLRGDREAVHIVPREVTTHLHAQTTL